MTNDQIIATLQKWQLDGAYRSIGVFVSKFCLQSQNRGFMLDVTIYASLDESYGQHHVYGETLADLFPQVENLIEQKKAELRKALDE